VLERRHHDGIERERAKASAGIKLRKIKQYFRVKVVLIAVMMTAF